MFLLATPGIPKGPPGPPRSGMHEGSTAISLSLSFPSFSFYGGSIEGNLLRAKRDKRRGPRSWSTAAAGGVRTAMSHLHLQIPAPYRAAIPPTFLGERLKENWGAKRRREGGGIQRANIYPPTRRPADPYRKPTLPPVQIKALPGAPSGTLGAAAVTAPAAAPRSVPLRPEPSPQSAPRSLLRSPHPPPKAGLGVPRQRGPYLSFPRLQSKYYCTFLPSGGQRQEKYTNSQKMSRKDR